MFEQLKYLVIIGDETIIPPLIAFENSEDPCDDCFSSINTTNPDPKLITGRILASNESEALIIINNIRNYTLSPTAGEWKSELLLFSDWGPINHF